MSDRLDLHYKLCEILDSNHVYFQPPESIKMIYPCIVYSREPDSIKKADDSIYVDKRKYQITIIDKNPDTEIPDRLKVLPYISFDRVFVSENLNHYVFTIFH